MSTTPIYLDHNATTAVDPRVLETFTRVTTDVPANPASIHTAGRRARQVLEDARALVAETLAIAPDEVFFVSGGTEANATVIQGHGDLERPALVHPGDHPSILEPARVRGFREALVDGEGYATFVPAESTRKAKLGLVCVTYGQSDLGALPDLDAASALAREHRAPIHVDAAQALGRTPLAPALAIATSVSLTVHKCGGLRGQGVLIVRGPKPLPLVRGGGHERGLRSGTPSPALAAATATAIQWAVKETNARRDAVAKLRQLFVHHLAPVDHLVVTPARSLANTVMVAFPGVDGRLLLPALDLAGVCASQGSACSSGSSQPPAILAPMGLSADVARSCVRFSFNHDATATEMVCAAEAVITCVQRLVSTSRL